jgi:hypothetical protein
LKPNPLKSTFFFRICLLSVGRFLSVGEFFWSYSLSAKEAEKRVLFYGDPSLGTTNKHLRRKTSGAAGNDLGATMKYLRRTTSAAANNGLSSTITPPCSAAPFELN